MNLRIGLLLSCALGAAVAANGCAALPRASTAASPSRCAVIPVVNPPPQAARGAWSAGGEFAPVLSPGPEAARGNAPVPTDAPRVVSPVDPDVARGNRPSNCP